MIIGRGIITQAIQTNESISSLTKKRNKVPRLRGQSLPEDYKRQRIAEGKCRNCGKEKDVPTQSCTKCKQLAKEKREKKNGTNK